MCAPRLFFFEVPATSNEETQRCRPCRSRGSSTRGPARTTPQVPSPVKPLRLVLYFIEYSVLIVFVQVQSVQMMSAELTCRDLNESSGSPTIQPNQDRPSASHRRSLSWFGTQCPPPSASLSESHLQPKRGEDKHGQVD